MSVERERDCEGERGGLISLSRKALDRLRLGQPP